MALTNAPNAADYMTARIRQEAYYCEYDRYIAKRALGVTEINDPKLSLEFCADATGIALVRMNDTEFLWIFAYANKEYDELVNELKSGGTFKKFKKFKSFIFGNNEWIYLPNVTYNKIV